MTNEQIQALKKSFSALNELRSTLEHTEEGQAMIESDGIDELINIQEMHLMNEGEIV